MDFDVPVVPYAFMDLDDTLVKNNTNTLWIRWRLRRDPRALLELAIALYNIPFMNKGTLDANKINRYYMVRTLGLTYDSYSETIGRFFEESGKNNIYPESKGLIQAYKNNDSRTVIITGQEHMIAERFREYLDADDIIPNRRIVENGKLGGFMEPNCYGDGKVVLANEYLRDKGCALQDCSFYTDSVSDLPLLMEVKYPVAVNPDRKLEAIAKSRNWPVLKFLL